MSVRPILFNTEMVKAILEGRKTMTRRIIKPQPGENAELRYIFAGSRKSDIGKWRDSKTSGWPDAPKWNPPYHGDDILYVRETFTEEGGRYYYRADFESDWLDPCETLSGGYPASCRYRNCDTCCAESERIHWRPSIHMPKEAARIFLRVKSVRVDRLQAITNEEAVREGFDGVPCDCANIDEHGCVDCFNTGWIEPPCVSFMCLWDSTIKPADLPTYGWGANPWVWVIEFERCEKPKEG